MTLPEHEERERFQLSIAQVTASSLAAISAAVVCSFFGVAGTVIGTAATSLIATIGSALYSYSLRRTKARLRRLHLAGAAAPPFREVVKTARAQGGEMLSQVPWKVVGIGTGLVFVLSIDVITAIEGGLGESLAAAFGVSHSGGQTTSLGSVLGGHHPHHKPAPNPMKSPSPSPTATTSTTPTPTLTPTRSSSPSASPSPTPTPTASPSLLPLPSLSPNG